MHDRCSQIVSHPNRKYLLIELLNGTHNWLFDTLSQINTDIPSKEQFRRNLGEFTSRLYSQYRFFDLTEKSSADFLHKSPEGSSQVMKYILNTFASKCNGDFPCAVSALHIVLCGNERVFDEFMESSKMELRLALIYFEVLVLPAHASEPPVISVKR